VKALRWRGAPSADNDALAHGMAMVAVPLVLGLAGAWIDSRLGTSPIFVIALAAFGVACSFASAYYRYERRVADHDAGKPWARSSPAGAAPTAPNQQVPR
jgi:positive regulator of sigma E activity